MASPSPVPQTTPPPPTFTPANGSGAKRTIHSTATSPTPPNGVSKSDNEDSPSARTTKRSHDSMMQDSMDIDQSSPPRPRGTNDTPGSPVGSVSTPRPNENRGIPAGLQNSMNSGNEKGTPSKEPGTGRRNYNTSFSGAKIKHLKKADGEPLWRKDIQYDWLLTIFSNDEKVFTNSYNGNKDQSFADVYIDAMARSSKTSKILRDKLYSDRPQAVNMAMVCLLVNIGRMNTTLNFFPEMRAQLRTYHAIPALQTYVDPNAYKQLQDAPRLKSILKGACEDRREPTTLDGVAKATINPRTNPINLIFLLANNSTKITDIHFGQPRDFFDLVMRTTLSSKSRSQAFLWLMWWYLESDFTAKDALANPFGPGVYPGSASQKSGSQDESTQEGPSTSRRNSVASGSEAGKDEKENKTKGDDAESAPTYIDELFKGLPVIVPAFEHLSEEQAALENVDLEAEINFGNEMKEERARKMAELEAGIIPTKGSSTAKKPKRPSKYDIEPGGNFISSPAPSTYGRFSARGRRGGYDDGQLSDSDARSLSPDTLSSAKRGAGAGRGLLSKGLPTPGKLAIKLGKDSLLGDLKPGEKRPRPLTQHQIAVQEHRRMRIQHEVDKLLDRHYRHMKRHRRREGSLKRAWKRIKDLPDPFAKSDDEVDLDHPLVRIDETEEEMALKEARRRKYKYNNGTNTKGPAGLVALDEEADVVDGEYGNINSFGGFGADYGEEYVAMAAGLRRARRRLPRWEEEEKAAKKKKAAGLEDEPVTGNAEELVGRPVNAKGRRSISKRGRRSMNGVEAANEEEFEEDDEAFEDEDEDATEEDDDEDDDGDDEDPDEMEVEDD